MTPTFTILLPVNRPPNLLPFAVASALRQTQQEFELFIICDGAPSATEEAARRFAARDSRIHVFSHPKGERHGELYRHQALEIAQGRYVCQLGDDDLWLPNHLAEIARLLRDVDFGNVTQAEMLTDGSAVALPGDLADAEVRRRMCEELWNFFGPTVAGYRLSAYRMLPVGWSAAPQGVATDLYMWRKFLKQDGLRFGTRHVISSLKFSSERRRGWPIERREKEIAEWAERLERCDADQAVQTVHRVLRPTRPTAAHRKSERSKGRAAIQASLPRRLFRLLQRLRGRLTSRDQA